MENQIRLTSILEMANELNVPKTTVMWHYNQGHIKPVYYIGKMPVFERIDTLITLRQLLAKRRLPFKTKEIVEAKLA